jgi:hypothetical protein
MSSLAVPATRALADVLRDSLAPQGNPVTLVIGIGASPPPDANAYANVTVGGTTIKVPKLKGAAQPAVGAPAYLLASSDFLLYIGTVSLTA